MTVNDGDGMQWRTTGIGIKLGESPERLVLGSSCDGVRCWNCKTEFEDIFTQISFMLRRQISEDVEVTLRHVVDSSHRLGCVDVLNFKKPEEIKRKWRTPVVARDTVVRAGISLL